MAIASPPALEWRLLGPETRESVERLHRLALASLSDPSLVRPETSAFFERVLAEDGEVVGAYRGDELIAYGILQYVLEAGDDPRALTGFAEGSLAKLAGAAVAPGWRGQGLQRELIRRRLARASGRGYVQFFSTAAPGNPASWRNLLACGFVVVALMQRYGGLTRYLVARGPTFCARPGPADALILRADDEAGQTLALRAGRRGIATTTDAQDAPCIVFASAAADARLHV